MIPKITHQIFMQGFDALPEVDRARIIAFRSRNPSWDHRFYDRKATDAWLAAHCDQRTRDAYYRIDERYHAARADLLRYLLCQVHGGVYLDIKSEAASPLDDVILADDSIVLSQWPELRDRPAGQGAHADLAHVPGDEFLNWFVVSSPGHPFLNAIVAQVLQNIETYSAWRVGVGRLGVLRTTGPIAYTQVIFPLLSAHPHRIARSDIDLDFNFSRFGDYKTHRNRYGNHYSMLTVPVIKSDPVTGFAVSTWYGRLKPEIKRTQKRMRKVWRMVSRANP